jgi:HPt (histidine-containing phosphotransfer) domain-containing protein
MFLEAGFQAFLSKPIDMMLLDEEIRRWVRDKDIEETMSPSPEQESSGLAAEEGVAQGGAGFDVEGCLALFDGDLEICREILQSYVDTTTEILAELTMPNQSELANYAITVHGLKGSSYSICAEQTGDAAKKLELAAKAGDIDFVEANHQPFIEQTQALLSEISRYLK